MTFQNETLICIELNIEKHAREHVSFFWIPDNNNFKNKHLWILNNNIY